MKIKFSLVISLLISSLLVSNSFAQEEFITRIDFAKQVLLMSNFEIPDNVDASDFPDIQDSDDMRYIKAAHNYKIIKGYNDNFHPYEPLTKEQALVMLVRSMDEENLAMSLDKSEIESLLDFEDKNSISSWAKPSIAYLVKNGLLNTGEKLNPGSKITNSYAKDIYSKCKSHFNSNLSRDGYSAALMLEKAADRLYSYNTYKFRGSMDMLTNVTSPSEDDMSKLETETLKMNVFQEGVFEKPEKMYAKSVTKIEPLTEEQLNELNGLVEQSSEVYYDGERYLMKMPGEDFWVSMDIVPLIRELQGMAGGNSMGNQTLTRDQMEIFGMYSGFEPDQTVEEFDCYVIRVDLDEETFNLVLNDIMDKVFEYYSANPQDIPGQEKMSSEEIEKMKTLMLSSMSQMNMNIDYKFYIEKESLNYKFMDIEQSIEMNMGEIKSLTDSSGRFEYYGFDKPVNFPEIDESSIRSMPSVIDGNGEQIKP